MKIMCVAQESRSTAFHWVCATRCIQSTLIIGTLLIHKLNNNKMSRVIFLNDFELSKLKSSIINYQLILSNIWRK